MTTLRIAVASLAVLLLAGCASTDERSSNRVAPQRATTAFDVDEDYIGRVEADARRRSVQIVWLSPPTKRDRSDD